MNQEDLQVATYRGVPFLFVSSKTVGGKKLIKKPIPGSNKRIIEETGTRIDSYQLSGCIAGQINKNSTAETQGIDYFIARDSFLDAIKAKGPAIFVHPTIGSIENVYCEVFNLKESIDRLGDAPIDLRFIVGDSDGLPERAVGSVILLKRLSLSLRTRLEEEFLRDGVAGVNGEVKIEFLNVFQKAKIKTLDFVREQRDNFKKLVAPITEITTEADLFLDAVTDTVGEIISVPQDMINTITGVFQRLNDYLVDPVQDATDLARDARSMYNVMRAVFTFGDGDKDNPENTLSQLSSNNYNDTFNYTVQCMGLAYAYENAANIEYSTVDDILEVQTELDEQYQKLISNLPISANDSVDELTNLRIEFHKFVEKERLNVYQVISVTTRSTSSRLLSYQYYGSSELGDRISEINENIQFHFLDNGETTASGVETYDSSYLEGTVKIFSV